MWYYMTLMLRISKLTDYAILVMVELTRRGEMLSAQAVAERVGIELPTASKVLKMLASHGLLAATAPAGRPTTSAWPR